MKAVIYACYSFDNQREESIGGQIRDGQKRPLTEVQITDNNE